MLEVTETIAIDEDLIEIRPIYASGPGGQHINKNMTAIQLRFDILHAQTLSHDVKQRLIKLAGRRVNNANQLVITAREYRSQERNRKAAYDRLFELIRKAAESPKVRKKKRRSARENQKRLDSKRRKSQTKLNRKRVFL